MILFGEDYSKDIIPIRDDQKQKNKVGVTLNIIDILAVNINSGLLSLKIGVMLEWFDSRLSFLNLKSQKFFNVFSNQDYESVWKPAIVYVNKEPSDYQQYVNIEPEITVEINILYVPKIRDLTFLYLAKEFSGEANSLQWSTILRYFFN
jgi:hypothetical protein